MTTTNLSNFSIAIFIYYLLYVKVAMPIPTINNFSKGFEYRIIIIDSHLLMEFATTILSTTGMSQAR